MNDIRFYDFSFALRHIAMDYTSVNQRIYYNDIGQFEAHFPLSSEVTALVMQEPHLIAVQGDTAAIVTGKTLAEDCAVFGRTCNWLLSKRVVLPFEERSGTAEAITAELAETAFSEEESFVAESGEEQGETILLSQQDARLLSETVRDCLAQADCGHAIFFDPQNRKWIYRVLHGEERPILLSEDRRNVSSLQYSTDCLNDYDTGWYPEETEDGSEWKCVDRGEESGILRWERLLSVHTEEEAEQELAAQTASESLKVISDELRWHEDYELGDVLWVQIRKGNYFTARKMRVTGVHRWFENGEFGEQPELGAVKEGENELSV